MLKQKNQASHQVLFAEKSKKKLVQSVTRNEHGVMMPMPYFPKGRAQSC